MTEIKLTKRYPLSRTEDITDAYMRGWNDALDAVQNGKFHIAEQTEPRLEQFRVGLEYHTDSVNFGKPKGESITTNKTEPQLAEKCPFDDSLPCEWVCTEYGKCKYRPKDEPQTEKPKIRKCIDKPFRAVWLDDDHNEIGTPQTDCPWK